MNNYFHWYNKHWKESFSCSISLPLCQQKYDYHYFFVRFKFDGHLNKENAFCYGMCFLFCSHLQTFWFNNKRFYTRGQFHSCQLLTKVMKDIPLLLMEELAGYICCYYATDSIFGGYLPYKLFFCGLCKSLRQLIITF